MIRKLALIAPFALLGLAGCNNSPAVLAKAQTGECFAVVGKETSGAPKLEKTACAADDQTAVATAEPATAAPAGSATPASATTPACPTAPVVCPSASGGGGKVHKASARVVKRKGWFGRREARSESRTEVREYARADEAYVHPPLPQELFGAPDDRRDDSQWSRNGENSYSFRFGGPPPARPMKRHREEQYSYAERGQDYNPPAPPPPPPPPLKGYDTHGDRSPHLDGPPPPPPPSAFGQGYGAEGYSAQGYGASSRYGASKSYESRSYSSESSSSSRSSSAHSGSGYASGSSGYAYGSGHSASGPCCQQTARGNMAPMNGPHFPVDQDGYLTWRGKTPAN